MKDIQFAVRAMLDRVATRVHEREVFKISRIVPCGSMVEQTGVWKYDKKTGERHTEFDFLAVLNKYSRFIRFGNGCGLCVEASILPDHHDTSTLHFCKYGHHAGGHSGMFQLDQLFLRELNTCLGSACDCFSVKIGGHTDYPVYSYKLAEACDSDYLCDKCVVEMSTGILRVNHAVSVGQLADANCSLVFRWTSKAADTLSACDKVLHEEARTIKSFSVHVDFLPALEVLNSKHEHEFFLVPKLCDNCKRREHWRKSNCMTEISYTINEMSKKHKKCYRIIKYLLSVFYRIQHGLVLREDRRPESQSGMFGHIRRLCWMCAENVDWPEICLLHQKTWII